VDFGTVAPGSRVTTDVSVRNTGERPLTVHRVVTSCDCLSVTGPSAPLVPGENGTFTVVLDLRKEPKFRGSLQLSADLLSEDHTTLCTLSITATVPGP
jgi:hypothetical protein